MLGLALLLVCWRFVTMAEDKTLLADVLAYIEDFPTFPELTHKEQFQAEALIARLNAAVADDGWETIESAPRDKPIVAMVAGGEMAIVSWMTSLEEGDGQWIISRGRLPSGDAVCFAFREPTHFRLLPPPPVAP